MRKLIISFILLSSSLMASNDYDFLCWLNTEYEKTYAEFDDLLQCPMPKDPKWEEKFFVVRGKLMAYVNVFNELDRLSSLEHTQ